MLWFLVDGRTDATLQPTDGRRARFVHWLTEQPAHNVCQFLFERRYSDSELEAMLE